MRKLLIPAVFALAGLAACSPLPPSPVLKPKPATSAPKPKPPAPTYEVKITRTFVDPSTGFTEVDGTLRSLIGGVHDFDVELKASSGAVTDAFVNDAHQGQPAVWNALFKGRVSAGIVRVTVDDAFEPKPLTGKAIISHRDYSFGFTNVDGTVTNTGKTTADYEIELLASNGATSTAFANGVAPGQTAIWQTLFDGNVTATIQRVVPG